MKKILSPVVVLLLSFLFLGNVVAKSTPGSWTGTLIDQMCAKKMNGDASKIQGHEKACIMSCAKNGKTLGMVVDGKFYHFDRKGETMAWKLLKKSTDGNLQVTVNGSVDGDKIAVKSISKA